MEHDFFKQPKRQCCHCNHLCSVCARLACLQSHTTSVKGVGTVMRMEDIEALLDIDFFGCLDLVS